MIGFFLFAASFVVLLTLVVRIGKLDVRRELPKIRSLGLTALFVVLLLLGWWFVTRGATLEARILPPLILPSPLEVLQAFPRLHFEQGLVRGAGSPSSASRQASF